MMFKKSKIKLPILFLIFIPVFILKVHLSIAYDSKGDRKKAIFIMTNFFLGYNLALIIFVELIAASFEEKSRTNIAEEGKKSSYLSRFREFLSSIGNNKKDYHDSLVEYCI